MASSRWCPIVLVSIDWRGFTQRNLWMTYFICDLGTDYTHRSGISQSPLRDTHSYVIFCKWETVTTNNLLLTRQGHIVHIDFGFMLSNSPGGNLNFETSPFKLTQEFLDIMDGEQSEQYQYFCTLLIRGFLE